MQRGGSELPPLLLGLRNAQEALVSPGLAVPGWLCPPGRQLSSRRAPASCRGPAAKRTWQRGPGSAKAARRGGEGERGVCGSVASRGLLWRELRCSDSHRAWPGAALGKSAKCREVCAGARRPWRWAGAGCGGVGVWVGVPVPGERGEGSAAGSLKRGLGLPAAAPAPRSCEMETGSRI